MILRYRHIATLLLALLSTHLYPVLTVHLEQKENNSYRATATLTAHKQHYINKKDFTITTDSPFVTITKWSIETAPITYIDAATKETVQAFPHEIIVHALLEGSAQDIANSHLHVAYYCASPNSTHLEPTQDIAPLTLAVASSPKTPSANAQPIAAPTPQKPTQQSWADYLSMLINASDSIFIRCLLVFLLGILMSLTPCIYPMIPITMGILQAQGSKSLVRNFSLALTYTCGIAITFACLGVMAVFTGQVFGSILSNPFFIITLVLLLGYLAFSMFGFYDMYIPRFMQQSNTQAGGSYTSAFLFGAASGSIASPCLSPGLVLLLTLVSALGSKLLGFLLLFSFGVGLGMPLLIIGTFSSSLSVLPRAGMWMLEIKKFFGFMLLGLCFHFLRAIIAWHILLWAIALFALISGIYYLYSISTADSKFWRLFKNGMGVSCTALSVALFMHAFLINQELANPITITSHHWHTDYQEAYAQAQREGKKLFIDIGADSCALCTSIDCTVMKDQQVLDALDQYVCLKVNGSDSSNPAFAKIRENHTVLGFPTFLLIDPSTNLKVASWGGELYKKPRTEFVADLKTYIC